MPKTITLSRKGLIEMLRLYDGKQFWSVRTVTVPDLLKKGRVSKLSFEDSFGFPPERLRKVCEMVIGMGYDYDSVVVHRLEKEGKDEDAFQKGSSWHCPAFDDTTIIRKNKRDEKGSGPLYVAVNCIANNPPRVRYVDIHFGSEVDKGRLAEFLKKKDPPKNQGLDNPVEHRVFKIEGIESLTCNGVTYNITDV